MRIVVFHAWSTLGAAVGHALLDDGHELTLVGAPLDEPADADPDLLAHARDVGAICTIVLDVDAPDLPAAIAGIAPELLLVATFPRRLPAALLRVPTVGAFNVHASLLPAYRGAQPEFWALRNGESHTGVTIHRMTEQIDGGPIVSQRAVALADDETLGSLLPRLGVVATTLVRELIADAERGATLLGTTQHDTHAIRAPRVTAEHLAIDWRAPAAAIDRLLRAARPCFDPTATLARTHVVVRSARLRDDAPVLSPGELAWIGASLWVGTGDRALLLERLEIDGEPLDPTAFARRHGLETIEHA